jgi:hypothetical protein
MASRNYRKTSGSFSQFQYASRKCEAQISMWYIHVILHLLFLILSVKYTKTLPAAVLSVFLVYRAGHVNLISQQTGYENYIYIYVYTHKIYIAAAPRLKKV